jgi:sugar phosphate isomerase/epimerase
MKKLYSVPGDLLRSHFNDGAEEEPFDAIRQDYEGIELYTGSYTDGESEGLIEIARKDGMTTRSLHPSRLERLHKEDGSKELVTNVNEVTLRYDDTGQREKVIHPDNITFHPSQSKQNLDQNEWDTVVENLSQADEKLSEKGNDKIVSLENCARFDPPYIISSTQDVRRLGKSAARQEQEVRVTLDVGHAPGHTYGDMADVLDGHEYLRVPSIHVHDKVTGSGTDLESQIDNIKRQYDMPGDAEIGTKDRQGEVDHLPVGTGEIDFEEVSSLVDDDTLVTVELHPAWTKRPETLSDSARYIENALG